MKWGTDFLIQYSADFAELESMMYAHLFRRNKRALRKPARLRKRLYGKPKLPYTIIHDCIQVNCRKVKA